MKKNRVKIASDGINNSVSILKARLFSEPNVVMGNNLRLLEALLFAAVEPIDTQTLRDRLHSDVDVSVLLAQLQKEYEGRGINLVRVAGAWRFQTSIDLQSNLVDLQEMPKKLSKAALETLAIIAYHQPVTRAEIEEVRGVAVSKGTVDVLMELKWVRLRGRRRTPGRPVTYGTTDGFLAHFNLEEISDLPGREDLRAAGLLDPRLPKDFEIPEPMITDDVNLDEEDLVSEDENQFFEDFLSES